MPTVEQNTRVWDNSSFWVGHGDNWSSPFGNTDAMWWFALRPRLQRYLPVDTILEIAPGKGRWTEYLRHMCRSLLAVDLSETCIATCKQRFADATNITYMVNDGRSLDIARDKSVDLVFSFDSLVHCERDIIAAYLKEISRVLKPDGIAVLHHSNMGAYRRLLDLYNAMPRRFHMKGIFKRLISMNVSAWRAPSVSAAVVRELCQDANLECISQELMNWHHGRCMIDAISVITPPGSRWSRPCEILLNRNFVDTAATVKTLSRLYA